jgi:hypothetical protein
VLFAKHGADVLWRTGGGWISHFFRQSQVLDSVIQHTRTTDANLSV